MALAKLFWTGRSQAVRLPKAFRLKGDRVRIRRHGEALILEPVATDWSWLDAIAGRMSEDFLREGREQPPMQERTRLDKAFR